MSLYCIVCEGVYSEYYSYLHKNDIKELAEYLNLLVIRDKKMILAVHLVNDYNQELNSNNRCFFETEYDSQCFISNYEERLLEKYRQNRLAV